MCDEADFQTWMRDVDRIVWHILGVSVYDLPDIDYRGYFDAGIKYPYMPAIIKKEEGID